MKEDKKRFTSYLPTILIKQLKGLSEHTRLPISTLVEEAVGDVLVKYYQKKSK